MECRDGVRGPAAAAALWIVKPAGAFGFAGERVAALADPCADFRDPTLAPA